jgi:hypothetical protein
MKRVVHLIIIREIYTTYLHVPSTSKIAPPTDCLEIMLKYFSNSSVCLARGTMLPYNVRQIVI